MGDDNPQGSPTPMETNDHIDIGNIQNRDIHEDARNGSSQLHDDDDDSQGSAYNQLLNLQAPAGPPPTHPTIPQPQRRPAHPELQGLSSELTSSTLVWGTTINIQDVVKSFTRFWETFIPASAAPPPTTNDITDLSREPLYPILLRKSIETERPNINVDCRHIYEYDARLYSDLIRYPQEMIALFDLVIRQIVQRDYLPPSSASSASHPSSNIQVRLFNLLETKNMRDLNPSDIDQLISIRGMIIRCSPIMPDLKEGFFQCRRCDASLSVYIDRGRINEPTVCPQCRTLNSMELIHNRSRFSDKQVVKLQETPDSIPEGETPHTVNLFVYDDLVDFAKPGDRVETTGIFRANSSRKNPRQRVVKSVYRTFMDVIHFQKTEKTFSKRSVLLEREEDDEDAEEMKENQPPDQEGKVFDRGVEDQETATETEKDWEEKEKKLWALASDPNIDIYERLTRSLAPSVWEMDDVKKGILLQLFGGTHRGAQMRGEINVLLCGDPGTSKSQLLRYVHQIAPRGVYTSGKGSSAVGLTASIAKDPDTRQTVLESGALVLSDRGVCCIDEFDKMSDQTRSVLHEVMEQQTVSVAKAGIIATLNARTSVLASANPRESRYNPRLSVVENLQLPPTLLSRFDLIFLVLDKPNKVTDARLARHIVGLYTLEPELFAGGRAGSADPLHDPKNWIDPATLKDYIAYARRHIHPEITDEAGERMVEEYLRMRKLHEASSGASSKKTITATTRQLESLIRLAEAHAKLRFSSKVEEKDVAEATRLVRVAIQQAAMDPRTGTIDMDLITTGRSATSREQLEDLKRGVLSMFRNAGGRRTEEESGGDGDEEARAVGGRGGRMRFGQIMERMKAQSTVEIPHSELRAVLDMLVGEGELTQSGPPSSALYQLSAK